jgi:hypothetical protein
MFLIKYPEVRIARKVFESVFFLGSCFTKVKVNSLCTHEGIAGVGVSLKILKLGARSRRDILHIASPIILDHPISGNFCVEIHNFVFSCDRSLE